MIDESGSGPNDTLDHLIDAQLIDAAPGGRYRLHDLMRLFAQERFEAEETTEERRKFWERLGDWYGSIAQLANSYIEHGKLSSATESDSDEDVRNQKVDALSWFDLERLNLLKVAVELHATAAWPPFFRLTDALLWYLLERGRASEGVALAASACEAAYKLGESKIEAGFLNSLGGLQSKEFKWADAKKSFERGLTLVRADRDRLAELGMLVNLSTAQMKLQEADTALLNLDQAIAAYESEFPQEKTDLGRALAARGNVLLEDSRWADSIQPFQRALTIAQLAKDLSLQSAIFLGLGVAFRSLSRWQDAIDAYSAAGKIAKLLGDEHGAASVLLNISSVYNGQGRWDEAIRVCEKALEVFRRFRDRSGEASALNSLGTHYTDVGDWPAANGSLEMSLEIKNRLGDPAGAAGVLSNLGGLAARQHRWEDAITHYSNALKVYTRLSSVYDQAAMRLNIASAEVQLSRFDAAIANLSIALPELESRRDRLSVGKAVLSLGLAYANTGELDKAIECYNRALQTFKDIGDPQSYGSTCHNIGRLFASVAEWGKAIHWYEKDLAICLQHGDKPGALTTLWEIGTCWIQLEDLLKAQSVFTDYLRIAREISFLEAQGRALGNLANIANTLGDRAKAIQLGSESAQILSQLGLAEAQIAIDLVKSLQDT
jgi:tetratricopeptide (TPR) repeat protein